MYYMFMCAHECTELVYRARHSLPAHVLRIRAYYVGSEHVLGERGVISIHEMQM